MAALSSTDSATTASVRARAVIAARAWIGTPYRHQASCLGAGTDCLGLVRGVWRALYGAEPEEIPPYSPDWAETGGGETLLAAGRRWLVETPLAEARPGDVLVFRWRDNSAAKHTGLLSAPLGQSPHLIHAYERAGVIECPLVPAWQRRIAAVFSFPETD
ncbi:peptidase P60 [Roseibium denhamense]|uniref:Phage cell wall peptidase, NlpC/P60 family n=1 Tax=Roseibium denhamense TaxID=76305 RepID=A0ABY1PLQ0_9HYPH|nr:NlpC/P60 family protein [Roseibium denhamense]MTI05718.1 peptidase P60 [Roseibium denhamense]SMP36942.1 putative phage cell wall peptidase, NlpC/P60 family [Roseibium denhamense]